MNYNDLMLLRDESIKGRILSELSEERREEYADLLDKAFSEGSSFWFSQQLAELYGSGTAETIVTHSVIDSVENSPSGDYRAR